MVFLVIMLNLGELVMATAYGRTFCELGKLEEHHLAFCQGLAFYLCVSALMIKSGKQKIGFASQNLLRFRRKTSFAGLSPPADSCAFGARGLFLTDHVKPSLWQRLSTIKYIAPIHFDLAVVHLNLKSILKHALVPLVPLFTDFEMNAHKGVIHP